jgi:hypothetical protein
MADPEEVLTEDANIRDLDSSRKVLRYAALHTAAERFLERV